MKILVVNNDLMERTVIQQVLHHNKHEIVTAENSDAAMHLLKQGDIRFVIADRTTSDIEEKEFIKHLREEKPPYYVYVLLITARVNDGELASVRTGADDYLNKPVAPIDLKSRVQMGERILAMDDNLVQAREALETVAMFDPLTNLLNLKAFVALGSGELERARRNQAPFSLLAFNIQNFKEINAKYGDEVAGDVLVLFSQAIREKSRPYDGLGLVDNSKILIPLPFVIGQDAARIANRLAKGVANTNFALLDGTTIDIRIGIGVVSATRVTTATEMEAIIKKAHDVLAFPPPTDPGQVNTIYI